MTAIPQMPPGTAAVQLAVTQPNHETGVLVVWDGGWSAWDYALGDEGDVIVARAEGDK